MILKKYCVDDHTDLYKYECFTDLLLAQLLNNATSHIVPLYSGLGFLVMEGSSHTALGDATRVTWFDCKGVEVMGISERECIIISSTVMQGKLVLVKASGTLQTSSVAEGLVTHSVHPLLEREGIMEAKLNENGDTALLGFKGSFVLLYGGLAGHCVVTTQFPFQREQSPLLWDFCRFDQRLTVVAIYGERGHWLLVRLDEDVCVKKELKWKPLKLRCEKDLVAISFENAELAVFQGYEFECEKSRASVPGVIDSYFLNRTVGKRTHNKLIIGEHEMALSQHGVVLQELGALRIFEPFEHSVLTLQEVEIDVVKGFAFPKDDPDTMVTLLNLGLFEEAMERGNTSQVFTEWIINLIKDLKKSDEDVLKVFERHKSKSKDGLFPVLKECIRNDRIKLALKLIDACEDGAVQKVDFYLLLKLPGKALEVQEDKSYAWEQLCSSLTLNQILAFVIQHPQYKPSLEEYLLSFENDAVLRALYLLDDRLDELALWYLEKPCKDLDE